jgi:hypothetical protein
MAARIAKDQHKGVFDLVDEALASVDTESTNRTQFIPMNTLSVEQAQVAINLLLNVFVAAAKDLKRPVDINQFGVRNDKTSGMHGIEITLSEGMESLPVHLMRKHLGDVREDTVRLLEDGSLEQGQRVHLRWEGTAADRESLCKLIAGLAHTCDREASLKIREVPDGLVMTPGLRDQLLAQEAPPAEQRPRRWF